MGQRGTVRAGVIFFSMDKGALYEQGIIFFSVEEEAKVNNCEQDFFVHHRILSAVNRVELVSDRMLCIVVRDC